MAAQPSSSTPTSSTPPVAANGSGSRTGSAAARDGTPKEQQKQAIPVRDKESYNKLMIERFLSRDAQQLVAYDQQRIRNEASLVRTSQMLDDYNIIKHNRHVFPPRVLHGDGYRLGGNGVTDAVRVQNQFPSQLVYPFQRHQRQSRRRTPPLAWKKRDIKKQAEQHEELVPVRIDIDYEKVKLRDTFTWNLHDRIVDVDLFTHQLLEDLNLEQAFLAPVHRLVMQQVQEQLIDFYPFAFSEEDALDPELPYSAYKNDEMRILIKLNITIGQHTLIDQFEWEINNPLNSPEDFAASMARDLSLSGEFTTSIAHCIREQCQLFTRSLYGVGHPFDGRPIEDPDLVGAFLPSPLPAVFRPQQQAKEYAPYLYELTDADIERNELVFSREQRRQKRSINRRGGPQLPDLRERQRTIRTLVMSSVLPGAPTEMEDTTLYKRVAGAPGGRKRPGARDGDLSESEESEDSGPDSPAVSQLGGGTARTRGLRGAATAAQHRMANLGRSETPEAAVIHHHETRRNVGRGGRDLRDDTEEPTSLIVTLKVSKDKLRRLLQAPRGRFTPSGSQTPGTPAHTRIPSASVGPSSSMPPPSTPGPNSHAAAAAKSAALFGGIPAPAPTEGRPQPVPPPAPEWASKSLAQLQERYPHDQFDAVMRYSCVNPETETLVTVQPGQDAPAGHRWMFLPRIKCRDCPGKSYTFGPETRTENFEKHLEIKTHRRTVNARVGFDTRPNAHGDEA
ncbi:snf5/smarcb1/ini1 [Plectosphaerella plurivora]|uniref:Snf5/smarcb1/ini1 n=1 Tax=Plectosphaerella plurivora TaxID=936078 RepID=A0A9P9AGT4_9PEZI|nr:snf5/smarcb1/ini1 [Plectosphaerella plurivora]